jgi:hypothetical protein
MHRKSSFARLAILIDAEISFDVDRSKMSSYSSFVVFGEIRVAMAIMEAGMGERRTSEEYLMKPRNVSEI